MTLLDGLRVFFQALGVVTFVIVLGALFFTWTMPTTELNDVLNAKDED